MRQTREEIADLWDALPQYTRDALQRLIVRDLPQTEGAVIEELDVARNDDDPDETILAIIVLSSGHAYAASFVPRPPGVLLH